MKTMGLFLTCIFTILLWTGCRQQLPDSEDIEISWELVSNTYSDHPQTKAIFHITNHSGFRLNDHNWALYFNQAPRRLISTESNPPTEVEWINGDWYRIVPLEGFRLRKGQQVNITYEMQRYLIKESDAPIGLYLVIYSKEGEQQNIINISDYTIKPFERAEQINRHFDDMEPIPDAAWRYADNNDMYLLPEKELKRIIPTPVSIKTTGELVAFTDMVDILYEDGLQNEADHLAAMLSRLTGQGFSPVPGTEEKPNSILLRQKQLSVNGVSREAYRLEVRANRNIIINGSDPAGVFYGIQSLMAILPVGAFLGSADGIRLEVMTIEDAPRFHYRGIHMDVARNFQTKETVLKALDLMAFYKINTFHFNLTEDEAWRLEIPSLPELAQVGGQREHPPVKFSGPVSLSEHAVVHPAYGSGPFAYGEGSNGSGYYTRDDFIEILQYATARHITVIPEVNLPAHARAAIMAMEARYNRLMAEGKEEEANEYRLIDPEDTSEYLSAQSFTDNVVNVARESVYRFFETVLDDIISMYEEAGAPLEVFHAGGDEVPEGSWTQSPMISELLKDMPWISDPKNLQAYFFERITQAVRERNLKIAGWEEVAQLKNETGQYEPNPAFAHAGVIPYIWNNLWGNQDLGYRLANMGYPIVQCHVSNFYFDLAYNKDPLEPGLYWAGFIDTKNAWYYSPFDIFKTTMHTSMGRAIDPGAEYASMERLQASSRQNVMGLQAQLWSETIHGQDMLQYYMLPKMIGFAESAWTAARDFESIEDQQHREKIAQQKWNVFANTLAQKELPRLSRLHGGYNYRLPLPGAIIENKILKANVEYPGLTIRYTTNGEEPDIRSHLYSEPVEVSGTVKIRAFDRAGRFSRTVVLSGNASPTE